MLSAKIQVIQEKCGVTLSSPMARALAEDFPSEEDAKAQIERINASAQPRWSDLGAGPGYVTPNRFYAPFFYDEVYRGQTPSGVADSHTSQVGYWNGHDLYESGFGSEKLKVGPHNCTRDFIFGSCDDGGFLTSTLTPSEWGCFTDLTKARTELATEEVAAYMKEREKVSARFGERPNYEGISFESLLSYPQRFNFEEVALMHRASVWTEVAAAFDPAFSASQIVYFVSSKLQAEQVNPYAFLAGRFSVGEIARVLDAKTPPLKAQHYLAYDVRFTFDEILYFVEKGVSPSMAASFDPSIEPLNIPWYREYGYTPRSINPYAPTLSELCSPDAESGSDVLARQLMDLARLDVPVKDLSAALAGPYKDGLCAEENLGQVLSSGIPLKDYFTYPEGDPFETLLRFSHRQSWYEAGISPAVARTFPADMWGNEVKDCLGKDVNGPEASSWMQLGYDSRTACDFAASDLTRKVVRPFDNHFGPWDIEGFIEKGYPAKTVNSFPDRFSGWEVESLLTDGIGAAEVLALPSNFSFRAVLAVHEDPSLKDKILAYPAGLDTDIVLDWIASGVSVEQVEAYPKRFDALDIQCLLKNDLLPESVSPEVAALYDKHYAGWSIVQMVAAGIAPELANDPRVIAGDSWWSLKDHALEELRPYAERFYFFGAAELLKAGVNSELANAYPKMLNGHSVGFREVIELQKRGVQPKDKNLEDVFMELATDRRP